VRAANRIQHVFTILPTATRPVTNPFADGVSSHEPRGRHGVLEAARHRGTLPNTDREAVDVFTVVPRSPIVILTTALPGLNAGLRVIA
jgi:hypothetical protein